MILFLKPNFLCTLFTMQMLQELNLHCLATLCWIYCIKKAPKKEKSKISQAFLIFLLGFDSSHLPERQIWQDMAAILVLAD